MKVGLIKMNKAIFDNIMSDQYRMYNGFSLWRSKGDKAPYWFSDPDGNELMQFKTEKEMLEYLKDKTLCPECDGIAIELNKTNDYAEFKCMDCNESFQEEYINP